MSEIPKPYEPQAVEEKWHRFWTDKNSFVGDAASTKPSYSIVIPPPNVTGVLTLGHVLNNTIQDILARRARMTGHEVLWLPGTDHAGIATQAVVERTLRKEKVIKHREDLGREKFLEKVWEWKEKHGGIIIEQLKKLGCSCDWTRERFTMDPEYSKCVQRVFVDLYRKGLIYRGKRMVNWDPAARTALSDEEVIMTQERGHLWHFKYPMLDEKGNPMPDQAVVVATTRPETMLGDEAVAVNPNDERYQKLIGRKALLPLRNKPIPIVADELVDPKFGTGCVKVTPAHDPADYEMGLRHNLPLTVVIAPDGTMTNEAGEDFAGLDRLECRKAVVEEMEAQGFLVKTEEYVHNVGYSERSHVPIEPYLSEQWFLKYPAVAKSTEAVEKGEIRFYPERWTKTYTHWMQNIKDWCISRQLWWGHRVPVWRTNVKGIKDTSSEARAVALEIGEENVSVLHLASGRRFSVEELESADEEILQKLIPAEEPQLLSLAEQSLLDSEFEIVVCGEFRSEHVHLLEETLGFTQDPDVLDTWFSSWLWPFATMGWTGDKETDARNATLNKFYPTTDLVTGPDIIFFWVARMIMAGYEYMGEKPFGNVYFTGIIRDKLGRKMSKSLGNSPDPLDLIGKYGADALRFGIMRSAPQGQDLLFDEQHVELGRNFCNKLWNACRFRQMQGSAGASPANEGAPPEQFEVEGEIRPELLSNDEKWILLKLDRAIAEITGAFEGYRFNEAANVLYRFFWSEYCDWFVEASKAVLAGDDAARKANTLAVLDFVLSNTLRLFHPFLPFITEELWHGLGYNGDLPAGQGGETIMNALWPKPFDADFKAHYGLDETDLRVADAKYELIGKGRNLRREGNIASNKKVKFVFKPAGPVHAHDAEVMKLLLNADPLEIDPSYAAPKGTPTVFSGLGELYLPLEGLIDVEAEKARLGKELGKVETEIRKVAERLNNSSFVQKVPANVLDEHKQRLANWQAKKQQIEAMLSNLG